MIGRKLRQARKGATVATDSCAGVWLGRLPPYLLVYLLLQLLIQMVVNKSCGPGDQNQTE